MPDVVLVSMPYAEVQRPSIALGLLQAALRETAIEVESCYPNLAFAELLGLDLYRTIAATPTDFLLGEWTFAGAAFPDFEPDHDRYLALTVGGGLGGFRGPAADVEATFRRVRARATAWVEELAASIAARRPRIVGCSSMFQQHCASLALLRAIRARCPETVTVLGGANCEGPMGVATARAFPWVDLVVSGEADELFAELCRQALAHGRQLEAAALPYGVIAGGGSRDPGVDGAPEAPPRATVRELDALPTPDYDDYFSALASSPLAAHIRPGLPAESSRGCWWGEKSHCTFCGLNGTGMGYRAKSGPRVRRELAVLAARYGIQDFELVDNILDMGHIRTVLAELAASGAGYRLFYETKANLKREQLRCLAAAGVRWIQPGIESLHSEVLALIAKGNAAMINLQLLKWARELGIRLSWNMLCGFPGERQAWYHEMAAWLPAIAHLQPPSAMVRVRYDRFSPFHLRPADFGLTLEANRAYRYVYPLPTADLEQLAYYFEDRATAEPFHRGLQRRPGARAVEAAVSVWKHGWARTPPRLTVSDEGDRLLVLDTRACARSPRWTLEGLAMAIYRACAAARTPAALLRQLRAEHGAAVSAARVDANVETLCAQRLMLRLEGKLLSLATDGAGPALPRDCDFPGGYASSEPLAASRAVAAGA